MEQYVNWKFSLPLQRKWLLLKLYRLHVRSFWKGNLLVVGYKCLIRYMQQSNFNKHIYALENHIGPGFQKLPK